MAPEPAMVVLEWFNRKSSNELYLTTITIAEMVAGVQKLPAGRRRKNISMAIDEIVNIGFAGRILSFDIAAAHSYGAVFEALRQTGHNYEMADVQIASIAKLHGASVATRDVKPFQAAGLHIINPWTDE